MININAKIMEAMKAHNKVASETYKMLKAKILEFKTAKNAKEYTDAELAQANVLQELLPTLPTEDDIKKYLNEHYSDGVEKKQMGLVIKEIKENLLGADGKLVSECVKNILK